MPASPPYSLAPIAFRFRAIAAYAGRASLGGPREAALACYVAARLAAGALPESGLDAGQRTLRAAAARTWAGSLALPAPLRVPLARMVDASRDGSPAAVGAALVTVADAAASYLDAPATQELRALAAQLLA